MIDKPASSLFDADRLRKRAAEMQAMANQATAFEARNAYEDLAQMYEQMANSVEELAQLQARLSEGKSAS